MIKPVIVRKTGNILSVRLKDAQPILWINNGLFALIPVEVVKNEISVQQDRMKLSNFDPNCNCTTSCTFTWDQAIIIPPEAGRTLAAQNQYEADKRTNSSNG